MKKFKFLGIAVLIILLKINCTGQDLPKVNALTADSLASGNYKDVFTSFFQLAVNDLTGPQKELSFTSNPFAIMARGNPSLVVDTSYVKYRHLRDLNFNTDLLIDSAYHIKGFSFGMKYALVNKRDETVSKGFIDQASQKDEFDTLAYYIGRIVKDKKVDPDLKKRFEATVPSWLHDPTVTFGSLDKDVQQYLDTIISQHHITDIQDSIKKNPNYNFYSSSQIRFQALKEAWQQKPLWTVGVTGTFKPDSSLGNSLTASNAILSTEFLVGLNSPKNKIKLELDLKATDSCNNDSTIYHQNIIRNVFSFEPGINFVFKSKKLDKPFFEFKFSGGFTHVFSKLYPSEQANISTLNGVIRIRLINDLWVPIAIKIDQNGHVYGSINLKMNFTTFANLLKS